MCKTIRDIIPIGSKAIINGQEYLSDETMLAGISEKMCPYIRFLHENGNCEIYGLDIRTNKIFPLQEGQKQAFLECNELHQKRFSGDSVTKTVIHKSDCYVEGHNQSSTSFFTKGARVDGSNNRCARGGENSLRKDAPHNGSGEKRDFLWLLENDK